MCNCNNMRPVEISNYNSSYQHTEIQPETPSISNLSAVSQEEHNENMSNMIRAFFSQNIQAQRILMVLQFMAVFLSIIISVRVLFFKK